jgi:phosphohistidine phosphatase SixA
MFTRVLLLLALLLLPQATARADDAPWELLKEPGAIVLFRHAHAPGVGDPSGFSLDDCSTQRNLDSRGRQEAVAIGAEFARRGIAVGLVLSSQWCRARDTAELAFPGRALKEPAFNSFFGNRQDEAAATVAALDVLGRWDGPGAMVVVSHQVNISALTGEVPRPGEGIIIRIDRGKAIVLGRLPPPKLSD